MKAESRMNIKGQGGPSGEGSCVILFTFLAGCKKTVCKLLPAPFSIIQ